jgi:hypothetical protein
MCIYIYIYIYNFDYEKDAASIVIEDIQVKNRKELNFQQGVVTHTCISSYSGGED